MSPRGPACLPRTQAPWSILSGLVTPLTSATAQSGRDIRSEQPRCRSLGYKGSTPSQTHPSPHLLIPDVVCARYLESPFLLTTLWRILQRSSLSPVGLQALLLYGDVMLPLPTRALYFCFQFFSAVVILDKTPLYQFSCREHLPPMSSFFLMLYFHYESKNRCSYNRALRKTLKFICSLLNLNIIRFIKNSKIHSPETFPLPEADS